MYFLDGKHIFMRTKMYPHNFLLLFEITAFFAKCFCPRYDVKSKKKMAHRYIHFTTHTSVITIHASSTYTYR